MGKAADVESIVTGKVALKHEGRNIDSIRAVAKAYVCLFGIPSHVPSRRLVVSHHTTTVVCRCALVSDVLCGRARARVCSELVFSSVVCTCNRYKDRSLHELETALAEYTEELMQDPLIKSHLKNLTEALLEENLLKLIEPYSWFVRPSVSISQ